MHLVKIPAIWSTVPDLSSVVILKRHRVNREEYFFKYPFLGGSLHSGVCVT